MIITESAANAILNVMKKNELDPKLFLLQFDRLKNGALGFTFSMENMHKSREFHGLKILLQPEVNMDGVTVDFGEINGRKGIIFMEKQNDNPTNTTSPSRNQKSS